MANSPGSMPHSTQPRHAHKLSCRIHSQPPPTAQEKPVIVISSDEDEPRKTSKSDGSRATQGLNQATANVHHPQHQSQKPTASSSRNAPKDGTKTSNTVLHSQESRHRVDSLSKSTNHGRTLPTGTRSVFKRQLQENSLKRVSGTSRLDLQRKTGHFDLSQDAQALIPLERSTGSREVCCPIRRPVEAQPERNKRDRHLLKDAQTSRPTGRSTMSTELPQNAIQSSSTISNSRPVGEQLVSKDGHASIPLKRPMSSREVSSSAFENHIEFSRSKQRLKYRERQGSKASEATLPKGLPNESRQIFVSPCNRLLRPELVCERRAVPGQERVVGSSSENPCEERFRELFKSERAVPVQGRVFGSSSETSRERRISDVSMSGTAVPFQGHVLGDLREIRREERFSEVSRSGRVRSIQERLSRSSPKSLEPKHPELPRSKRPVPAALPLPSGSGSVLSQTISPTRQLNTTLPDSDAHGHSEQSSDTSHDCSKQPSDTSHDRSRQSSNTWHTPIQQPTDSSHARSKQPSDASHAQSQQLSACPLHRLVPAVPLPKISIKTKPQSPDWSQIPLHLRPLQGPVRPDEFSDSLQKTWILENKPHLGTRHGQFIFSEEINNNQMWENPEIPSIEVNVPFEVRECMSNPKKAKEYGLDNSLAPPLEYIYTDRIVYRNNEVPIPPKWHCNCHGDCRNNPHCECRAYQTEIIKKISKSIDRIDEIREFEGFAYTSTRKPPNSHAKKTHEGDSEARIIRDVFIHYMLPVFECNHLCGCGPDCLNRTVGRGRREKLSLEKTLSCGWGVFAGNQINYGRLVTHYSGELISEKMSSERVEIYDQIERTYLFVLDPWWINKVYGHNLQNDGFVLIDEIVKPKPVKPSEPMFGSNASTRHKRVTTSLSSSKKQKSDMDGKTKNDGIKSVHCVDAFWYGNISRYINHSCSANTTIVPVYIDDCDPTRPIFAMFANKLIQRGKEITTSYCNPNDSDDSDEEDESEMANAEGGKLVICKCGAPNCKGKIFA